MNNLYHEEYTIDTPENVSFGYEVAGIGSRFIGALIDTIVIGIALFVLNLLLGILLEFASSLDLSIPAVTNDENLSWIAGIVIAIYVLLNFLVISGYYMIFEFTWNGQTPGKRVAKARVIRVNGNPAGFLEIVVRNLVRIVDFLPLAYGVGLAVMFFNHHARRLGDFAAGTIVVKEQAQVTLATLTETEGNKASDLRYEQGSDAWLLRFPNLRQLTANDYALIQETLHRYDHGQRDGGHVSSAALARLAAVIASKLAVDPPTQDWQSSRHFLIDVTTAYRHVIE